jgi:threonylcarbamoyladenosine tRNA methylthiotransferase MtaB
MNQYKKVAFYTFGCKLNFSETSTIAKDFEEAGYAKVEFDDTPDIFVINTCSVTENADKKCKQLVKKTKKINPEGYTIIIGCYAQLKPKEISSISGVNMVLGANDKFNIVQEIENVNTLETVVKNDSIKTVSDFIPSFSQGDRTRSFLKVQDGCDYFCSFCTIPLARGKSRNASVKDTVKEAEKIAKTDIKEVVLTGVNIGDFGQGGKENFFDLVKALDQVDGIDRFRISSIEPNLLDDEIISYCLSGNTKFVPHFHIPLQSGSDEMLKSMRRKYDTALYTNRVYKIKSIQPDCCIGVDVIVGYPGETDEEFLKTYEYLKELPISYLHVFTYSERANTTAKKMKDVVPMNVRKERSKMLRILSEKKKRAFYESQLNKSFDVLWESDNHDGFMHGFSENYLKFKKPFFQEDVNTFQKQFASKIDRDGLFISLPNTEN